MAYWDQADVAKQRYFLVLLAEVDWTLDTFNFL